MTRRFTVYIPVSMVCRCALSSVRISLHGKLLYDVITGEAILFHSQLSSLPELVLHSTLLRVARSWIVVGQC